jgi:predicted transcriptional regulator
MTTPKKNADDGRQINPTISGLLDERLEELAGVYRASKTFIANVAIEYGAFNFEKAWKRYNAQRAAQYRDDDDRIAAAEADAGNVVKLPPTKDAKT